MEPNRKLGIDGPRVSAIGYGAMGLEGYYGKAKESEALEVIQHAIDAGCAFIDTADAYGNGHNEQLVGRAVANRRNEASRLPSFLWHGCFTRAKTSSLFQARANGSA